MINSGAMGKGMEKVYLSLTIYICKCWSVCYDVEPEQQAVAEARVVNDKQA